MNPFHRQPRKAEGLLQLSCRVHAADPTGSWRFLTQVTAHPWAVFRGLLSIGDEACRRSPPAFSALRNVGDKDSFVDPAFHPKPARQKTLKMKTRAAVHSDLEAIARLQAVTRVTTPYSTDARPTKTLNMNDCTRVWRATCPVLYHPSFALDDRSMFVALDQSRIIGFIAGHRSTRMGCLAELQWTFVLPERQRQGIGAQLLSLLQAWFRSHQATRVIVDAAPNSP